MPPVGFEPTVSAGERPQTYALDRAATGTGYKPEYMAEMCLEYSLGKRTHRWLLNIVWNACLLVKSSAIDKIYLYIINQIKYSKPH